MDALETGIDRIFENFLDEEYFAGGVCCVRKNGQEIFLKAYGERNIVTNEKMETDTIFDLASLTKIVTSTLILKMISNQQLTLETMLKNCLPMAVDNNVLAPLTIEQLLTHSSGLIAWHPLYADFTTIEEFCKTMDETDLIHQEQKEVVYSDLNYILLGEVIKEYFHSDLQTVLQRELVSPLKLQQLTYGPLFGRNIAATEFGNRTEMEMCRKRGKKFSGWRSTDQPIIGEVNDGNAFYFFESQSGHAGIFGTAEDLGGIAEAYQKANATRDNRFIDQDLIENSFRNISGNRGLGWHSDAPFPVGIGHTGFTGTSLWIVPEHQLTVILLTNRLHVEQPKNINSFREEVHQEILSIIS